VWFHSRFSPQLLQNEPRITKLKTQTLHPKLQIAIPKP
jgi:hypothetical protein